MAPPVVAVSPGGAELLAAYARATRATDARSRRIVGVSGSPGSGKSTLAGLLVDHLGRTPPAVAQVPMDGFHLADVELARLGLGGRKGAPETFDAWGYAALLARLRARPDHVVMAPAFTRDLDQPLAGAIAVAPAVDVVLTEGNYLLLDDPPWRAVGDQLDEVWHVSVPPRVRREWLVERHVRHGRSPEQARAWVDGVDEPNAALVEQAAARADLVLDLGGWDWRIVADGTVSDRPV